MTTIHGTANFVSVLKAIKYIVRLAWTNVRFRGKADMIDVRF